MNVTSTTSSIWESAALVRDAPSAPDAVKVASQDAGGDLEGEDKLRESPILTSGSCAVTPLRLPRDCCEVVMTSARAGLMSKVLTQAMAGGSSPVTMAGTLALHNSEVLSGCILSQLTQKGAPFMYASSTCSMDLRFGTATVGNPETALMNAAIAEISRYYLLPVQVAGG